MAFIRYMLIALFMSCAGAQEAPQCSSILSFAEHHLPHCGVLRQSQDLVYVDVDDNYIHKLAALLQSEGFVEPPYFQEGDGVGAHITVIYPHEIAQYGIAQIAECGELISFTPLHCKIVHPPRLNADEVYLIVVDAPQLDQLRTRYGLPPSQYAFHITIAVKPAAAA